VGVIGLLAGLGTNEASACSTPVYRYAMYNWPAAPYFVFYFHFGEPAEEDKGVNQSIAQLAEGRAERANFAFEEIDLSLGHFDRLPSPVKEAWVTHIRSVSGPARPAHLVFTSWGAEFFTGVLDEATVRRMVASPARATIGELFKKGSATVIVFVPGSNTKENQRAEKVCRDLIRQGAAGELGIEPAFEEPDYSEPTVPPTEKTEPRADDAETADEEEAAPESQFQIGLVKVDRSDPAERWFLRSLLKVEADLEKLSEDPMVFFAYGRGRVMWPYVGKGITADNVLGEVFFLSGPCSCQVRDQNPGVDLLMHWDWEATAEAMAATDPAFRDVFGYEEFTPEETDPE
jgi:hypothetical protein